MPVFRLTDDLAFPDPRLSEPDGLLAVGGDLSQERLLLSYASGIFPWYSRSPILWWSPDPRLVLFPDELRVSRSLRQCIRKGTFRVTVNQAFGEVIRQCAAARRKGQRGTWITRDMISAYCALHASGHALSVESWSGNELAGGLYGVVIGKVFFGESMFSQMSNASKAAFVYLVERLRGEGFRLIDCQVTTGHLERFGAREIPRAEFLKLLRKNLS